MTPYKLEFPGLCSPVCGLYPGDEEATQKHVEKLAIEFTKRIQQRKDDMMRFKAALSGVRITKWMGE